MPITSRLTLDADTVNGTPEDDIVVVPPNLSNLTADDRIRLGAGFDTMVLERTGDYSIGFEKLQAATGLDALDISAGGEVYVKLDAGVLERSDEDTFRVVFDGDPVTLELGDIDGILEGIVLAGTGRVTLNDSGDQHVAIADGFDGHVIGNAGSDMIVGGDGADRIAGGDGRDTIEGGAGDDTVSGDGGNDIIVSDGGDDVLTGGEGDDVFVIRPGAGRVTITDFEAGALLERVDLSAFDNIRGLRDVNLRIEGDDLYLTGDGLDLLVEGAVGPDLDVQDVILAGQSRTLFSVGPDTPIAEIQALLDAAPAGSVVTMLPGTYNITQALVIDRSDITLRGSGEGETILRVMSPDDDPQHAVLVHPEDLFERLGPIASTVEKGTREVTLSSADHGLVAGDLLFLNQANDAEWLAETGNDVWDPGETGAHAEDLYLREFRSRVIDVNGATVTLAEPAPFTFEAGIAEARNPTYLTDVHVSDFTVEGRWGTPDPNFFDNTLDAWASTAAVEFDGVESSTLARISVINPAAHAFRFQRTYEVTGEDLYAEGAHNKDGSNGYHYYLLEAFRTDLQDITSIDARHALLFSSYSAEHYNDIHIAYTNRDINFHGSPDADNRIVVDRMVQEYPDGVTRETPQWPAVGPGVQPLHPLSAIADNDVTFHFARLAERPDDITAHDDGGNLDGGGNNDTLRGGASTDYLRGGANDDTLWGHGGRDGFIWALGDGIDTVMDFQAGRGGDVVALMGTAYASLDDLRLVRDGADTLIKFGTFGEMRLVDVRPGELVDQNFRFFDQNGSGLDLEPRTTDLFLLGTPFDDRFVVSRTLISSDDFDVVAGSGTDTVRFNITNYDGALQGTGSYSGVDVFDVGRVGNLNVTVSRAIIAQSDNNALTLDVGDTGNPVRLNMTEPGQGALLIDGTRQVEAFTGRIDVTLVDPDGGDVVGGNGADRIRGGAGADRMEGGAGADDFVFEVPGSGFRATDVIVDFGNGADRILLDVPEQGYPTGALPDRVFAYENAGDAADRVVYDRGTGELIIDINGSQDGGERVIAVLSGAPDLSPDDIFLI